MVSPGKLRALSELVDGDHDAFEPSVGETGEITYPRVERALDGQDGDPVDFLETMADRGVLASEVEYKRYRCPDCSLEGMQYSTGCPNCGSVHATKESAAVHPACGTPLDFAGSNTVEETRAEAEESFCPDCDETVSPDDLENDRRYRCHDCTEWFDSPTHRLWCRGCDAVSPPGDAHEEPVYRYPLTPFGRRWITEQVEKRRLLVEAFEARGCETSVDTSVSPSASDERRVHVYAEDGLFDYRIVAGVHGPPTVDDVRRLVEAAREVDARPILLSTDGSVDERVAEIVDRERVTVVSASDGTLSGEFDVADRPRTFNSVREWVGSLFSTSRR